MVDDGTRSEQRRVERWEEAAAAIAAEVGINYNLGEWVLKTLDIAAKAQLSKRSKQMRLVG